MGQWVEDGTNYLLREILYAYKLDRWGGSSLGNVRGFLCLWAPSWAPSFGSAAHQRFTQTSGVVLLSQKKPREPRDFHFHQTFKTIALLIDLNFHFERQGWIWKENKPLFFVLGHTHRCKKRIQKALGVTKLTPGKLHFILAPFPSALFMKQISNGTSFYSQTLRRRKETGNQYQRCLKKDSRNDPVRLMFIMSQPEHQEIITVASGHQQPFTMFPKQHNRLVTVDDGEGLKSYCKNTFAEWEQSRISSTFLYKGNLRVPAFCFCFPCFWPYGLRNPHLSQAADAKNKEIGTACTGSAKEKTNKLGMMAVACNSRAV